MTKLKWFLASILYLIIELVYVLYKLLISLILLPFMLLSKRFWLDEDYDFWRKMPYKSINNWKE